MIKPITLAEIISRNPALAKRNPDFLKNRESEPERQRWKQLEEEHFGKAETKTLKITLTKIKTGSTLENKFYLLWTALRGPPLVPQFKFMKDRKYRLDFYQLESRVGIEISGGIYQARSGHRSYTGVKRDAEKQNELVFAGIKLFTLTPDKIETSYVKRIIEFCNIHIGSKGFLRYNPSQNS